MATKRDPRSGRFQGLSRPDPRLTFANLRALGAGASDSSYTQQGARAGIPEAQQTSGLVLQASGVQGDDGDLEILTGRAGHPLPDDGGFLVRDVKAGDSTAQYLGHDGFQVITGWDGSIRYDTSGTGSKHAPPIIRLLSGDLLLAEYNLATTHRFWRMSRATFAWSNVASFVPFPSSGSALGAPALLQLPSGRVLYFWTDSQDRQVHVRYSDDDGTTWADYALSVLSTAAEGTIIDLSVAVSRGTVVLFTMTGTTPLSAQQWVSADLGATFDPVGVSWYSGSSERPRYIDLVGLPSGQVAMFYWMIATAGAGTEEYVSRIIDPGAPGYDAPRTSVLVSPAAPPHDWASCAMWPDEDGLLYAMVERAAGTDALSQLLRSDDGGSTWIQQKVSSLYHSVQTERPHHYRAACTGGRTAWAMRWIGTGPAVGQSLGIAYLGGHSRATVGTVDDAAQEFVAASYIGWGQEFAGQRHGACWTPFAGPPAMGWATGGVGGQAMVSPSRWRITTVAATRVYSYPDPSSVPEIRGMEAGFVLRVNSGGALATQAVSIECRISDYDAPLVVNATAINKAHINFTTTGFRVYDSISGLQVGSDQAFDTTLPTYIQIAMRKVAGGAGELVVWYGRPGGPARRLTVKILANTLADDSGANPTDVSRVRFGHIAIGTAVSEWELAGFTFGAGGGFQPGTYRDIAFWANPGHLRSRHFPTTPALVLDNVKLRALDGPTRLRESWRIRTRYDYGVQNIHPALSPSPRVPWRSHADGVVERIVWDLEGGLYSDAFLGNHQILALLLGSNIKTAHIKGWNVGTVAWDTLATLSAVDGYSGLKWERAGSTVRPDNGATGVGERYLWRHQHAGDTFDLGSGEERFHRIKTNTEGAWRVDGSGVPKVKQPTVWLEADNLVGTEPSSGTGDVWVRDFGSLIREYDDDYQRIALEIPAQSTADGYYQLGVFHFGDILPFGQQYDLGWVWTRLWNTAVRDLEDGTRHAREIGPRRRTLEIGWVETAVQVFQEQADDPDPDYLSSGTGGLPVASRGDVLRALEGLLEQSRGGVEPLVYLSRIEQQDGAGVQHLTDRRRWLYGRVRTDLKTEVLAARQGEGVDEVERLNRITIEEEL